MRRREVAWGAARGAALCLLCAGLCASVPDGAPAPVPYGEILKHLQSLTAQSVPGCWQYRIEASADGHGVRAEARRLTGGNGKEIYLVQWQRGSGGWQPVQMVTVKGNWKDIEKTAHLPDGQGCCFFVC